MEKFKEIVPDFVELYKYFIKITEENPDIVFWSKEVDSISKIQAFIPLIERFWFTGNKKRRTPIYRNVRLARELIEGELKKDFPIVLPLGFILDNDYHLEFISETLNYHLKEQTLSLLRIVLRASINFSTEYKKLIVTKIKESLFNFFQGVEGFPKNHIEVISSNLGSIIEQIGIDNLLIDLLEYFLGVSEPEIYMNEYSSSYDVLLSFFARPLYNRFFGGRKVMDKTLLKKLRDNIDSKYYVLFKTLNPSWRNAFVHKNYIIDNESQEIIYYKIQSKGKTKIKFQKKITKDELVGETIYQKMCIIALLMGSITYYLKWAQEHTKELSPYLQIFKPNKENEMDLFNFIIMRISDTLIHRNLFKEGSKIEAALTELIILFNQSKLAEQANWKYPKINNGEELSQKFIFQVFWTEIFKDEDLKLKDIRIIIAYFLSLLSFDSTNNNLEGIDALLETIEKNARNFKFNIQNLYFEISIALAKYHKEKSNKMLLEALKSEKSWKYELSKEDIFQILSNAIDVNQIPEDIDSKLQQYLWIRICCSSVPLFSLLQMLTISNTFRTLREEIMNNLPEPVIDLKEELSNKQSLLPLSLITTNIRRKKSIWPKPDFSRPKDCLRFAEKIGLVYVEIKGDFYIKLVTEIKNDELQNHE